ncbi:DUF6390 family protein [Aldersonia kunmingensis]|uniref:DUF6390 family protein n=1 Tax=Aldersonia kunmingensis TaxID=408066 RepID=UPI000835E6DD|nr:DUF6390 family protein [Aldersonia kunmingensis]
MAAPPGHRLFARYVHTPNSLGYCGPADAAALEAVACGHDADGGIEGLARKFTGAWPYQQLIAELSGVADPLDERVGRAYWTGNELTEQIDGVEFGRLLLARFAPQAAHYWKYLTDGLLDEAAPTHIFHVLGIYPWTRLLNSSTPEAVHVLDSCRIAPATVVGVGPDEVVVREQRLEFDGRLSIGAEQDRSVRYRVPEGKFVGELDRGDLVAIHWDFVCDRLSAEQGERLTYWTRWQCERTNRRL